jgi:hypothetical protein
MTSVTGRVGAGLLVVAIAAACGPSEADRRAAASDAEFERISKQRSELEKQARDLEEKVKKLEQQIAERKAKVPPEPAPPAVQPGAQPGGEPPAQPGGQQAPPPKLVAGREIHGAVQAVDNKADVCVIAAGAKDGVAVGMDCVVSRKGDAVATLVIEKVFPNYSSGSTKKGTARQDIQPGDDCAFVAR